MIMKHVLLAASLLIAASSTHAETYIGVGYQFSQLSVEDDDLSRPLIDGRSVDLSDSESDDNFKLLVGYNFNANWGLELSFYQLEISNSDERLLTATEEEEWEASVEGNHFALAPVYTYEVRDNFGVRATAGIVYGDYDVEQSHSIDVENGPDRPISRSSGSESEFGGMVGVGVVYRAPWNIDLLAEYQYSQTKIVSNSAFSLSAAYRF
jgi:opacity protein-like surface antigen